MMLAMGVFGVSVMVKLIEVDRHSRELSGGPERERLLKRGSMKVLAIRCVREGERESE